MFKLYSNFLKCNINNYFTGAVYAGLDFGTIYSSISIWKAEKPYLVDLQGVTRILTLIESSSDRQTTRIGIGKTAMELYVCTIISTLFLLIYLHNTILLGSESSASHFYTKTKS